MMKVGIDLVEVKRFKNLCNNKSHLERIFLPEEIEYIDKKRSNKGIIMNYNDDSCEYYKLQPVQNTVAGLYAAKEAVLKATGIGVNNGIPFKDVLICHDENGAPQVKLYGKALDWQKMQKISQISLSISHDGGLANAICIMI